MRLVQWTDSEGYHHLSYVRDNDPDELAPQGVPCDPPDLEQLDWDQIKRDVHNLLVSNRLVDWESVKRAQNGVTSVVNATLRRELLMLYRQNDGG